MSIAIMSKVWWLKEFSIAKKMVLLALADSASDEGYCWPGKGHLSTKCSVTKMTILNKIKELEKEGYLEVIKRKDGKGAHISNAYQLNIEKICNPNFEDDGGIGDIPGGYKTFTRGSIRGLPLNHNKNLNQPLTPSGGDGDSPKEKTSPTHGVAADFATLWEAYPMRDRDGKRSKGGKGEAETAWRQRCRNKDKTQRPPPLPMLLIAIERLKENTPVDIIANASTWINQGRWQNHISPEEINTSLPPSMGKIVSRLALRLQTVLGNIPYHKEFEPHPFTPDHAEYTGMNATVRAVITEWDEGRYPTCDNGKQLVKRYTDWLEARDVLPSARGLLPRDGATWKQFVKQLGDAQ